MNKLLNLLYRKALGAVALSLVATTGMVSIAYAQHTMKDPARDNYYNAFKGKRVVFVPVFMGLDLTEGWSKLMKEQSERLGYKYEVRNPNFNTSAGAQILTSLISEKPDVIVVQNPDVQSYARLLLKAEKAGIRVIQLNMKTNILTTGFVGADAVQIGELQAGAVVKQCGPSTSGKVLILGGPATSPWSVYLQQGYENILSKHSNIKVVARQSTGNYESAKAKSITQVVLQQHPDLCAVLGVWDNTDVGTAAAIKESGKAGKVFVSSSGGGGELACKGLNEGLWDHYVSYDVPGQGRDLTDLISAALQAEQNKEKVGATKTVLYTPLIEMTKANVKDHPCWSLKTIH
ncbi:MAG: sugar ABC transporter substrate-binding protein [Candidimonas sp.]|nr:MAG: sugar ABC transporter substrate-binding protein [Candidimonas sp.]TAM22186.1 MAG: sugar ABC transporter substrate-binding protein [Candidimonas sp.]